MPVWTRDLVLAEARWAARSPLSDGYREADPAGLLGPADDWTEGRALIAAWLCDQAYEAARLGNVSAAVLRSWLERIQRPQGARSTSTTRNHLQKMATALAIQLADGRTPGPAVPGRSFARPPQQRRASTRPDSMPSTSAARQRRYRGRLLAVAAATGQALGRREDLFIPRSDDAPSIIAAREEARQALLYGYRTDLALALERLAVVLNDVDDPMAAVAGRWSAESFEAGSLPSYLMHNMTLGVVARHPRLARGPQREWAAVAANTALRAVLSGRSVDMASDALKIRHYERSAQLVLDAQRVNGLPLNTVGWRIVSHRIDELYRRALNDRLHEVPAEWRAVLFYRQFQLNIAGFLAGSVDACRLRGIVAEAGQLVDSLRCDLLPLRRAQLYRERARALVLLGDDSQAAEAVLCGFGECVDLPGQQRYLRELAGILDRRARSHRPSWSS